MNQKLFDYMYNEHGVTLLETDAQEIERLVSGCPHLLAEVLIAKLQEILQLFPDEDRIGLYDRGLYDAYLTSLKIVTEECAKQIPKQ